LQRIKNLQTMEKKNVKQSLLLAVAALLAMAAPVVKAQNGSGAPANPPAGASPAPANKTAGASTAPAKPADSASKAIRADDPSLAGYTIGEQDVLDIDVWREKELTLQVVVRPDGKITVPLVNEVYVVGVTPLKLQDILTEKLQPFITAPQVTVSVREINSRKVYLIGQVAHIGVFHINSTTTVSQIIIEAGGLKEFAKRKKIYVLRNVNGKELKLAFNYDAVLKGQGNAQDVVLKPGDKIVVP
jgi:polysaccharide export outer membrane protein